MSHFPNRFSNTILLAHRIMLTNEFLLDSNKNLLADGFLLARSFLLY